MIRIGVLLILCLLPISGGAFDNLLGSKLIDEDRYQFEPIDIDNLQKQIDFALSENDAETQYRLGRMYEEGINVSIDYTVAAQWYEAAVEGGFVPAMLNLSRIYFYGAEGIPPVPDRALALLKKAAEAKEPMAFYELGVFYETVEDNRQNYQKALQYYQEAAKRGVLNALGKLAIFYQYGLGVEPNIKTALKYYDFLEKKSDNPSVTAYVKKQRGELYVEIALAQSSYEGRFRWMRVAAQEGHVDAMHQLAIMYEQGLGVAQHHGKAAGWFTLAAKNDSTKSITRLGYLYMNGYGVEKNFKKALEKFTEAAELGDAEAAWNIGNIYYYGYAGAVDKEKASLWFKRSENLGKKTGEDRR